LEKPLNSCRYRVCCAPRTRWKLLCFDFARAEDCSTTAFTMHWLAIFTVSWTTSKVAACQPATIDKSRHCGEHYSCRQRRDRPLNTTRRRTRECLVARLMIGRRARVGVSLKNGRRTRVNYSSADRLQSSLINSVPCDYSDQRNSPRKNA